jgi:hypothetical protein
MSKKRPEPEVLRQIRQVLTADEENPDWPRDLVWARQALGGQVSPPPADMDPEVVHALVQELVSRRATETITALAKSADRRISKAARTALHRLRTQKVDVRVPVAGADQPAGTGQQLSWSPICLATVYDPRWERDVGLVQEAPAGITLVEARISARFGLVDVLVVPSLTRKRYRDIVKRLAPVSTEISRQEARWLVEDAVQRNRRAGRAVPEGYARASQIIGPAPGGQHPALSLAPSGADPEELLALYELPELARWLPDQEFLYKMMLQLQEVSVSRLMIDDQQRKTQLSNVLDRSLEEYFTDDTCAASRQLLLDTAHLLWRQGREPEAGLARAAAELFELPRERTLVAPFVRHFLERLARLADQQQPDGEPADERDEAEQRSEGGLILPGGIER